MGEISNFIDLEHEFYNYEAAKLLDEAFQAELDLDNSRYEEAASKFEQAKSFYEKAENFETVAKLEHKIAGNCIFNSALDLQAEAIELYEKKEQKETIKKCDEVIEMFAKAKSEFEKSREINSEKIGVGIQFIDDATKIVDQVVTGLRVEQLVFHIGNLNYVGKPENNQKYLMQVAEVEERIRKYCEFQMIDM